MRKIISYILFGNSSRYWGNIPYITVANSAVYNDFIQRFYIHKDQTVNNCFFDFLKEAEKTGKVDIRIVDDNCVGTKLTLYRLSPIWENDVDVLLCRDTDYAVSSVERKSVEFFIRHSNCVAHGIRSYALHTIPYMAGLCGFKVKEAQKIIIPVASSFNKFLQWSDKNIHGYREGDWGCDQSALRDFMSKVGMYKLTLDCPQFTAPIHVAGFECVTCLPDRYKTVKLFNCDETALSVCDSIFKNSWTGMPWTCPTNELRILCNAVNDELCKIVKLFNFI